MFLALLSCLPLSFPGNVQDTISINQVLSNKNLISYNKFVQVQGPRAVSRRWAWRGTGMGTDTGGLQFTEVQAGTGPDRGCLTLSFDPRENRE